MAGFLDHRLFQPRRTHAGGVERDVLSEGMKISLTRRFLALAAVLAIAPWASAHPGHEGDHGGVTWDFAGGFAHPLSGWDHLLAMVAVGLWAAQLGGRARWLVPSAFVADMVAGAALGRAGFHLPGSEQAIAASVLVLGLLLARAVRLPVTAGMALVGAFRSPRLGARRGNACRGARAGLRRGFCARHGRAARGGRGAWFARCAPLG